MVTNPFSIATNEVVVQLPNVMSGHLGYIAER